MSLTRPVFEPGVEAPSLGVVPERPKATTDASSPTAEIATKIGVYIASAVLIGTGYHLWQEIEANVHIVSLWSSLLCYALGFALAWYGSLNTVAPSRRENMAITGLLLAFVAYAVNYTLFRATAYGTDAMLFNAYSAELLTRGVNPYAANMQPAFGLFGVPTNLVTPTVTGGAIFAQSYPALSFLVYVPFALLGQSALWLSIAAHLGLLATLVVIAPRPFKALAPVILFADPVYTQYTLGSVTDIIWALPAVLCAYYWRSKPALAAFYLGLACGFKQSPWFIVPFAIVAWAFTAVERRRWLSFFEPLCVLLLTFFIPNAPFIIWDPHRWLSGVMTPMAGNLIAFGSGIVQLTTANVYATDLHTLTTLSAAVLGLLLVFYAVDRRRFGFVPFLAPGIALFFAARSLQNYFMFWPVALMAYAFSSPGEIWLRSESAERRRAWAPIAVAALATIVVGFMIVRGTTVAAYDMRVSILHYGYDNATKNVNAFNVRLANPERQHPRAIRFGVLLQGSGDDFIYWTAKPLTVSPGLNRDVTIKAPNVQSEIPSGDHSVQVVAIDADAGTQAYSAPIELEPLAAGIANPMLTSWLPGRPSTPVGWDISPTDFATGWIRRIDLGKHRGGLAYAVAASPDDEWHVASVGQKLPGKLRRFSALLRPYQNYVGEGAYPRSIFGIEMIDSLGHHAYYVVDSALLHAEVFKHDQFTMFQVPGRIGAWNTIEVDPAQLQRDAGFMLSDTSQVEINILAGQHHGEPGTVRGDFGGIESQ
ncbi:MAG: hypothetical protein JO060_10055 [Candidatus Eremiobacteraeota bacterium]|nr:hypothetical protein [Candidatus Eremiobacteraeota bacterium]